MTAAEMNATLLLRLQEIDAERRGALVASEANAFLQIAEIQIVKEKINSPEFKRDLYPLIREDVLLPAIDGESLGLGGSVYEYLVPDPSGHLIPLSAEAGVTRTANPVILTKEYLPSVPLDEPEVYKYKVSTLNKPYIKYPRVLRREDGYMFFCDHETTMIDARITYVKQPVGVYYGGEEEDALDDIESELPAHVHDEVIQRALDLILTDIKS